MVLSLLRNGPGSGPVPDRGPDAGPDGGTDTFGPGGELTLGVEEELLLVDEADQLVEERRSQGWIARVQELTGAGTSGPDSGVVSGELFGSEIEFATVVCPDAALYDEHHAHLPQRNQFRPGRDLVAAAALLARTPAAGCPEI